jgi:hypothetical protein
VYAYDPVTHSYDLVYAESDYQHPFLNDPDNAIVCPSSGDVLVCEDAGTLDMCLITPEGTVSRFIHLAGKQHGEPTTDASSEVTGPCFDPSGTRLYFSSQRAYFTGVIYEVTGPWRRRARRPEGPPGGPGRPGPLPLRLRMEAVHRVPAERLEDQGLRVALTPSKRADVEVVLRAPRDDRGASAWIVLGRAYGSDVPARRTTLRLRLSDRGERYVEELDEPVRAQLVATAVAHSGRRVRVTRAITIY